LSEKKEVVVEIDSLANSGDGVGRVEGMVHFVPFAVPGDKLEVTVEKRKKTFCRSTIATILEKSEHRIEPPCPYFGSCGGCSWQQVAYAEQLRSKRKIIEDAIARIAGLKDAVVSETVGSPHEYGYRIRERFTFSAGKIGFFAAKSNRLVPIDKCLLAHGEINDALALLRSCLDGQAFRGLAGSVELTLNPDGEVTFDFQPRLPPEQIERLVERFKVEARDYTVFAGQRLFMQTNEAINALMIEQLLALPQLVAEYSLVELFAGSGNFTLPLAGKVARIAAVEKSRDAVAQLELALGAGKITNVELIRKWSVSALGEIIESGQRPELVLLDPPREGAADEMYQIGKLKPKAVIYISCNSSTLARDISLIETEGYAIDRIIPFDMFPQTPHVEIMTVLKLN
jgi:23S rRNA (uracil1939-C5)-methyltransferase